MNRKQKRAKRMKARHHSNFHGNFGGAYGNQAGDRRTKQDVGGLVEDVRQDYNTTLVRARATSFLDRMAKTNPEGLRVIATHTGLVRGDARALSQATHDFVRAGGDERLEGLHPRDLGLHTANDTEVMSREVYEAARAGRGGEHGADDIITTSGHIKVEPLSVPELSELSLHTPGTLAMSGSAVLRNDAEEPFDVDKVEAEIAREGEGGPAELRRMPTREEWDEMVALAKKRKKGIAKVAQKAGWVPDPSFDAKTPQGWEVPVS